MSTHDVILDWVGGQTRTIEVGEDETVLTAAERVGVGLPYGCRTGACGTCVGRLLAIDRDADDDCDDGMAAADDSNREEAIDVTDAFAYRREPRALKPRHHDDGYVLLCIARPRANSRVAVGSRIQSVENPWK